MSAHTSACCTRVSMCVYTCVLVCECQVLSPVLRWGHGAGPSLFQQLWLPLFLLSPSFLSLLLSFCPSPYLLSSSAPLSFSLLAVVSLLFLFLARPFFFFFFNSLLKSLHVDQIIIYLRISFLPSLGSWMLSPELGTGMILHHSGKSERVRFI